MGSHLDSVAIGGRFDGSFFRSMQEQGVKTRAPLVLINWTNEEGARFFLRLETSSVYAGKSTIEAAHASTSNGHSGPTRGGELAKIGYVGNGPNTFEEFPISAYFEIHVEQAGYDLVFPTSERRRRPCEYVPNVSSPRHVVGVAKIMTAVDELAHKHNGRSMITNVLSGPRGACNIRSSTRISFCLMNREAADLEDMGADIEKQIKGVASRQGLELEVKRDVHLLPRDFWPEATDCIRRACGDKGITSHAGMSHGSTMTTTLVPTGMVFVRAKDDISHCAKEWSDKDDSTHLILKNV
ncbi:hypothetical protein G6011_05166 [Alternaria panax]|uniref:Peptidase M20 dimerisation domain-containing protein n=1 Tax=Alternaria panax TaxID=48097 RepID=A0AAD4FD98_9PLEO|nr:hypothetical protein G6011_05166 [Alternaria panax]